ncbi:Six-hairpin glycosidase [Pyrenochaeta sp. DS3sAY3a]|nr:Six-hairpin glycosidase [Pyrenochaeta sp. DS3sAY3a]
MAVSFDRSWMWHPSFSEERVDSSGLIVIFRRRFMNPESCPSSVFIHITADTRYKLYVNGQEVAFGPVKGDQSLWFFDQVDIGPFLRQGQNQITVRVLRLFFATNYAPSFPRLASGGLRIKTVDGHPLWQSLLDSSADWETVVDERTTLRIDEPEDNFLHIYEKSVPSKGEVLSWVPAKLLEFKNSTGNAPPWNLLPRQIPSFALCKTQFSAIHNVESALPTHLWEATLIGLPQGFQGADTIVLLPGTKHRLDLEMQHHTTAFVRFKFRRPTHGGAILRVTYSESYEDEPEITPGTRRKEDRCNYSKSLYGPSDIYEFEGLDSFTDDGWSTSQHEIFAPFHWRTLRFVRLEIQVASTPLILENVDVETVNYPLDVQAAVQVDGKSREGEMWDRLWSISIRTLRNCMHDCYEDCPLYEQLQYAMDTRSSALFTYLVSGDDRLARQAIMQIHSSFQARLGLTASRAPTQRQQYIPHFSLYWVCLVSDHFEYFGDKTFVRTFLPVIDAILSYFDSRIEEYGLVTSEIRPGIWNYVDWTQQWKPHGVPPAIQRTGISTFSNELYAYTLHTAGKLVAALGRPAVADEYHRRTAAVLKALKTHCFDGTFFTDTVATASTSTDYSQHCQVWAVLSGVVTGHSAQQLLRRSMEGVQNGTLVKESVSMAFYTLRALSLAGGTLYEELFRDFWAPWRQQLEQNLTTWVEDDVSQRSDCHAWGSVPISELIIEVLGVRPATPGCAVIEFRPRTTLFRTISARVPLRMNDGRRRGALQISWKTGDLGNVEVMVGVVEGGSVSLLITALEKTVKLDPDQVEFCFIVKVDNGSNMVIAESK